MITVVCGTNRKESNSKKVAGKYANLLKTKGAEVQVLHLENLPSDFVFSEINDNKSAVFEAIVDQYIKSADKFVFIIPEYNGGFPGVLKAFIDVVPPSNFKGKKAALVGVASGHAGALRPLDQFTHVLHHIRMEVFSDKPKLSAIENLLDSDELNDEVALKRIGNQIDHFLKF